MNAEKYKRTLLSLKLAGILVTFSKAVGLGLGPTWLETDARISSGTPTGNNVTPYNV